MTLIVLHFHVFSGISNQNWDMMWFIMSHLGLQSNIYNSFLHEGNPIVTVYYGLQSDILTISDTINQTWTDLSVNTNF